MTAPIAVTFDSSRSAARVSTIAAVETALAKGCGSGSNISCYVATAPSLDAAPNLFCSSEWAVLFLFLFSFLNEHTHKSALYSEVRGSSHGEAEITLSEKEIQCLGDVHLVVVGGADQCCA